MDGKAALEASRARECDDPPRKEQVLIGIGGNLGDPEASCREAVELLRRQPEIVLLKVSSLYRTEPVGKKDQGWFVNAVALCETSLDAERFLGVLQEIERKCGRVRRERWGPRTLDLDILGFGDSIVESAELTLPHPRLHERKFVLVPLLEILPQWTHPRLHRTGRELLADLDNDDGQAIVLLESL